MRIRAVLNDGISLTNLYEDIVKEHFHPSMHNPNFDERMDAEFKAQLSEQGYVHEILAEFGTQDTGVFDKNKIDAAREGLCYAYNDLDYYQELRCKENNINPKMFIYDKENKAPYNPYRCMGVKNLIAPL